MRGPSFLLFLFGSGFIGFPSLLSAFGLLAGRLNFCILRRHRRANVLLPRQKLCAQLFRLVRELRCKVVRFAQIIAQVVEFQPAIFEELNELPVTGPDCSRGRGAPGTDPRAEISGEMPVDRVPVERGLAPAGETGLSPVFGTDVV